MLMYGRFISRNYKSDRLIPKEVDLLDVKAQLSIAVVPLLVMSITFGAALSIWNEQMPIAYDVSALPSSMDNYSVVFLGISPGSNSILGMVEKTTTHITRSDNISALNGTNDSNYMVLIDGDWARKGNQGELIGAVRSLILKGIPLVIINGESDIIRQAIEGDQHIGYMISISSNPLHSDGIHYDVERQSGESYAYSSIDGDLALAGMNAYTWCAQFLDG
jgi:hypothetical protein